MTNSKTAKINLNLNNRFDALIQRAANWHTGAYKTANDQLYELLADTYELYLQIVDGDSDVRKQFNNLLKSQNVSFQDNTPIQTRVVRLVFAIDRKRAYTYANVLRLARVLGKTVNEIPDWIREKGGVQEVSADAVGGKTTSAKAKDDAEFASETLAKSAAIVDLGKLPAILKPGETAHPNYSLALIRTDDGSTGEIVWGTGNATLITRVLALAAKDLRADNAASAETAAVRSADAELAKMVKRAVESALHNTPNQTPSTSRRAIRNRSQLTELAA